MMETDVADFQLNSRSELVDGNPASKSLIEVSRCPRNKPPTTSPTSGNVPGKFYINYRMAVEQSCRMCDFPHDIDKASPSPIRCSTGLSLSLWSKLVVGKFVDLGEKNNAKSSPCSRRLGRSCVGETSGDSIPMSSSFRQDRERMMSHSHWYNTDQSEECQRQYSTGETADENSHKWTGVG